MFLLTSSFFLSSGLAFSSGPAALCTTCMPLARAQDSFCCFHPHWGPPTSLFSSLPLCLSDSIPLSLWRETEEKVPHSQKWQLLESKVQKIPMFPPSSLQNPFIQPCCTKWPGCLIEGRKKNCEQEGSKARYNKILVDILSHVECQLVFGNFCLGPKHLNFEISLFSSDWEMF